MQFKHKVFERIPTAVVIVSMIDPLCSRDISTSLAAVLAGRNDARWGSGIS